MKKISNDFPDCPFRNVIARFADKWSMLILFTLNGDKPIRYSELRRSIPDISSRVLSGSLKVLEEDDLITRTLYPEVPPRVEYTLSERGRSLMPHILNLADWAKANMQEIKDHRKGMPCS